MLDFSGESKKNKRFFIFFVKKEPFLSAPKGMGFPGLKFIMKGGKYPQDFQPSLVTLATFGLLDDHLAFAPVFNTVS